jgi:pentose-5-phosphate-3-epimerase
MYIRQMTIFWTFVITILVFVTTLPVLYRVIPSISGANLTCINDNVTNVTKLGNQSINLSIMSEEYFKNLTSDNPQFAQLICEDILNHTTK